jgi:hypothetical protein
MSVGAEPSWGCPRCGAPNAPGALECWRCQSPARAIERLTGSEPPPLTASVRIQQRRKPSIWVAVAIPLVAIIILVGATARSWLGSPSLRLPDALGTFVRVEEDKQTRQVEDQLARGAQSEGASLATAVYRQPGQVLVLEVFTGVSSEATASSLLEAADSQLGTAGKLTIQGSQVVRAYGGVGITQACAPVSGEFTGSLCYWTDLQRVGFLMGVNIDVTQIGSLAEMSRIAVDG